MGASLNPSIVSKLGDILGQDFGSVRIHTGPEADVLNRRIDSIAFARGSEIFFGQGSYRPDSEAGVELLAHELIHVCQQLSGRVPHSGAEVDLRPADDAFEREARELARPVAALIRGNQSAVSETEFSALRDFSSRPRTWHLHSASRTIQRTAVALVAASNVAPPGAAAPGPTTCHEAAIGWLLTAENYTSPWKLMRYAMSTLILPASAGSWLKAYVYNSNARINQADVVAGGAAIFRPNPGDILFTCQGGGPAMHSMIVVPGPAGPPGNVFIRGFNNAGTFNYPAIAPHAPPGAYDANDRDVGDPNLWNAAGTGFGANAAGAELHWVKYQNGAQAIRNALAHWTHSNFRGPGGGHGWQHTGGPPCPASCPH